MIRHPPRFTRTDTLSLHDALPISPPSEASSTATECVATAAISHAPLMPAAIDGLVDRTMTAVKKAYITRTQRKILSRSEEHTSELQSLMRISYAFFCLKKKKNKI